jgi:P pilus assembly chaperone PapD
MINGTGSGMMRLIKQMRLLLFMGVFLLLAERDAFGGISVTPKKLFLDPSKKAVPVFVTNPGQDESEVWIDVKYGYVESDESGKGVVVMDSSSGNESSSALWVKPYPQRFILPPGESQTVRFVAFPPPGLQDGEYWARIIITGKPRKAPASNSNIAVKGKAGISFSSAVGIPLYYRKGKVSTALSASDVGVTLSDSAIHVAINLTRLGNAAFIGTQTIRVVTSGGKVVQSQASNIVVFKTFAVREIIGRRKFPPGKYTLEVDITGRKSEANEKSQIEVTPLRTSTSFDIP